MPTDRLLGTGDRIRRLHLGQLAIVLCVGALSAALLLSVRKAAAIDERMYGLFARQLEERIDSLYGDGYLVRRTRRLQSPREPSDDPYLRKLDHALDSLDEQNDLPSIHLVSLYEKNAAKRDDAGVRLMLLDAAMIAIIGLPLCVLWVWFGGRDTRDS